MKRRLWALWLCLIAVVAAACGSDQRSDRVDRENGGAARPPPQAAEDKAPASLRAAYVATVQKKASKDYAVEPKGAGLEGANAEQRLRFAFTSEGVEITPARGGQGWSWKAAASRWGCDGALTEVPSAAPQAQGNRVAYEHAGLRAWYVNGPLGLEQGFTLAAPPACRSAGGRGVVIDVGGGDLRAEVSSQGDAAQLLDGGGKEALRYTDLYAVDATGRQLGATMEGGAAGLSIRVDDEGAVYPIEIDPLIWVQQQELFGLWFPDAFGASVALSGDTAIIGAPFTAGNQGSAYVFVRNGTAWTQQQELLPGTTEAGEFFGWSIAIDGDTAVVGAPTAGPVGLGHAYAFVRSGTVWTLQQQLAASDGVAGDGFGNSVAVVGDTAFVGAPDKGALQGVAYVFARSNGNWTQEQELVANEHVQSEQFGFAVATSGDTAVVGARSVGAYVYVYSGAEWVLQQEVIPTGAVAVDQPGFSVAIDGDTMVTGSRTAASAQGAAYVFTRSSGNWVQEQEITASDGMAGDHFGNSVAVSGGTVVVGSYSNATYQAAAYVFVLSGGEWTQVQELPHDGAAGTLEDTGPVAIDHGTVLVGSAVNVVYVFVPSGTVWAQQQVLSGDAGDQLTSVGWSVALSGDTAIVGAPFTGQNLGEAYVYVRSATGWNLQTLLGGAFEVYDLYVGHAVAIDGDTAVIGAYNDVYVYVRTGTSWALQQVLSVSGVGAWYSVAVSGDTAVLAGAVIRAPGQPSAAYVFSRSGGVWTQQQQLAVDNSPSPPSGLSVAVDGNTAAVGAPSNGSLLGAVYVFTNAGGVWTQQQVLAASDGVAGDQLGYSVALQGDTLVAGASSKAFGAQTGQGAAYVFTRSGGAWTQQQELAASDGAANDFFGFSVALSGDTAVVGGLYTRVGGGALTPQTGAAYVFTLSGGVWTQQQELVAASGAAFDLFGQSVAVVGETVIVGAPDRSVHGVAYVFVLKNGSACATADDCASHFCVDGVCCNTACGGGDPTDCQACSVAAGAAKDGTCGPTTGNACDDGDACTQTDTCRSGACVGSNPVVCTPLDTCHAAGTCDPATGLCSNPTQPCTVCVAFRRDLGSTVEDAMIEQVNPTSSYDAAPYMQEGDSHGGLQYDLLSFDVGSIPSDATVISATVLLRELFTTTPGTPIDVHAVTAPWSESSVTWASFGGAFSPSVAASFPSGGGSSLDSVDVTALAQAWVSGTTANDGVLLEQGAANAHTAFVTSEAGGGAGQSPELDVCYSLP